MKTKIIAQERSTIEEFATKCGLTMEVKERKVDGHNITNGQRWYAQFENAEVKDGGILSGVFGNGESPECAIRDYARSISGRLLVVDAYKPQRKELNVPILI